jgi:hypothetical protein
MGAHRTNRVARGIIVWSFAGAIIVGLAVAPPAGASNRAKIATGSVHCSDVTGTILYSPAIHHVGTGPGIQKFIIHVSGCATTGSNVHRVSGGTLIGSIRRPVNSCLELLAPVTSQPPVAINWKPSSIKRSLIDFSGFAYVLGPMDHVGFRVPPTGGTATVAGSFSGHDHGARSTATLYTNTTAQQFEAACVAPAGVARQAIVSGTATLS